MLFRATPNNVRACFHLLGSLEKICLPFPMVYNFIITTSKLKNIEQSSLLYIYIFVINTQNQLNIPDFWTGHFCVYLAWSDTILHYSNMCVKRETMLEIAQTNAPSLKLPGKLLQCLLDFNHAIIARLRALGFVCLSNFSEVCPCQKFWRDPVLWYILIQLQKGNINLRNKNNEEQCIIV